MNILALDLSCQQGILSLSTASADASIVLDTQRKHGEVLLAGIRQLLSEHALDWSAIDLLALGIGPGSFTGLRMGLGVMQAIAYAQDLPLLGLDSLLLLAASYQGNENTIYVAQDAYMDEVYFAGYRKTQEGWTVIKTPCLVSPDTVLEETLGSDAVLIGSALTRYPILADKGVCPSAPEPASVSGSALIKLAKAAPKADWVTTPTQLSLCYLRGKTAWRKWSAKT